MGLHQQWGDIEKALADLDSARHAASALDDALRRKLDQERLDPMTEAAKKMAKAVTRADAQISAALRKLED